MEDVQTLGWQVQESKYTTSDMHRLIGVGSTSGPLLDNIGDRGCNLTFAVLSMNRSSLTIKLMESIAKCIPDFAGEFLIGDNGSAQEEREALYAAMERMPYRCRMVEFDRNYGVSGGRNRLFARVRTEWIFSMDNDTWFIADPLDRIRTDIAKLGCHFMTVPVLNEENRDIFLYGGHLYVGGSEKGITISGGSAYVSVEDAATHSYESFLCTFLPGCVGVLRKDTFFACGGFDEGLFVGFEDTDFSLRLFQGGYKIGSCAAACVVHEHPRPQTQADRQYEQERFSREKLKKAADYFEKKHGISVWTPETEAWVTRRGRELLGEQEPPQKRAAEPDPRPKVLLVPDVPGWAYHNIAKQIIKHCSDEFDFKLLYMADIKNAAAAFWGGADCDIIHFLWRPWVFGIDSEESRNYIREMGMEPKEFYRRYVEPKVVCTSVYDHLFINEDDHYVSERMFTDEHSLVKAYAVSSEILKEIYDNDPGIRIKPDCVITDGVDLNVFRPQNPGRFRNRKPGQPLVIGWAGNSLWAAEKEDFKGLHTLIKPAVEELRQEGYVVELSLCDRNVKQIPHHEMPAYYSGIDLYVCMSKIEGTPNPILESMACGVPFVSTRVGIVPEAAGPLQSEFILEERSVACLKEKLKQILEHPEILEKLSEENLCSIQSWEWRGRARKFIDLWQRARNK